MRDKQHWRTIKGKYQAPDMGTICTIKQHGFELAWYHINVQNYPGTTPVTSLVFLGLQVKSLPAQVNKWPVRLCARVSRFGSVIVAQTRCPETEQWGSACWLEFPLKFWTHLTSYCTAIFTTAVDHNLLLSGNVWRNSMGIFNGEHDFPKPLGVWGANYFIFPLNDRCPTRFAAAWTWGVTCPRTPRLQSCWRGEIWGPGWDVFGGSSQGLPQTAPKTGIESWSSHPFPAIFRRTVDFTSYQVCKGIQTQGMTEKKKITHGPIFTVLRPVTGGLHVMKRVCPQNSIWLSRATDLLYKNINDDSK